MIIIPAIDIMRGKVVRLEQGDFNKATTYDLSAVDFAKKWESQGAGFLHVVDLDGARTGEPKNTQIIKQIIKNVKIPVEVGGGIRTLNVIRDYLEMGVARVVLSTKFLENPSFLYEKDLDAFIGKIAISIDIKKVISGVGGKQASITTGAAGWTQDQEFDLSQGIKKIVVAGVKYINFSDISRDGMMQGLDIVKIKEFLSLVRASAPHGLSFIYAGGISTLVDIKALKDLKEDGVDGVIVGRALYENGFSLKEAIEIVKC